MKISFHHINNQDQILESIQMEESLSYFEIHDEQEEYDYAQEDNIYQTMNQENKFKSKDKPENEKEKGNSSKPTKQQLVVNQTKRPLQMNYNVVDELTKLHITLSIHGGSQDTSTKRKSFKYFG
jgi:hypothetical protein